MRFWRIGRGEYTDIAEGLQNRGRSRDRSEHRHAEDLLSGIAQPTERPMALRLA